MESLPDPMLTATATRVPLVPLGVDSTPTPCPTHAVQQAIDELLPASTDKRQACTQRVGKVLHIINGEHFSGAERVQQLLGKRLGRQGFETEFACIKLGKFPNYCSLRAYQISQWPMQHRLDLRVVRDLARHVIDEQFDLLHAHTPRSALIASQVARYTHRPWVYHVHSPTARDSTRGLVNRLNAWLEWYAIRNCDRLLTVSRSLRREMLRLGVPRTKLSVVPNGVPAIEPISTRARMHCNTWTIGMIALMRPRKGVEVAMQAMRELKTNGVRNVTLELIGSFESEPYEHQILAEIKRLGLGDTIRWSGFTDDIPATLSRLDALLLPSLFGEGMPMVVLESLSAGLPVVATRVEGTPEVVRDGVEGYLAQPRDSHSLATCIRRLVSDRETWSELSRNAVKRHREHFSDQRMAVVTASAYRKLLAAHRGGQPSSGAIASSLPGSFTSS